MAQATNRNKGRYKSSMKDPTRKIGPGIETDVMEGDAELSLDRAEALQTPPISDAAAANRLEILKSPSYQLAEVDVDFLSRKENRPLRMQLEMLKTETLLARASNRLHGRRVRRHADHAARTSGSGASGSDAQCPASARRCQGSAGT